jgi:hypothetical protein
MGRIPTPPDHASRPSFDKIAEMINVTLVDAPQSHADAKTNVSPVLSLATNCGSLILTRPLSAMDIVAS